MTYVLGWKTKSNVYLAADSMITGASTTIEDQSSFGESHIKDGVDSVSERALKIVLDGDLAIGLCGNFQLAIDMATFIFRSYRLSRNLEQALQETAVSHGPFPMPMHRDVRLIVAWRGEPFPRLFSFNHDGYGAIHEFREGEGVPLGSVGPIQKGITQKLLPKLFSIESKSGSMAYLASVLGVLQSLGIHDYLLKDGVGGSFTGLCVNHESITWQPDLLYMIDEQVEDLRPCIATCIRDQSMIVNSSITGESLVFMTIANDNNDLARWLVKWGEFAKSFILKKKFDYVVLLGLKHRVIIVVEMKGNAESKMFGFLEESEHNDNNNWFEINTELMIALNREFKNPQPDAYDYRFRFIPYEPLV